MSSLSMAEMQATPMDVEPKHASEVRAAAEPHSATSSATQQHQEPSAPAPAAAGAAPASARASEQAAAMEASAISGQEVYARLVACLAQAAVAEAERGGSSAQSQGSVVAEAPSGDGIPVGKEEAQRDEAQDEAQRDEAQDEAPPVSSAAQALQVCRFAAALFEAKDEVLASLAEDGAAVDISSLPPRCRAALVSVRADFKNAGCWPEADALKAKKVFGRHAVRYIRLPVLPEQAQVASVYVGGTADVLSAYGFAAAAAMLDDQGLDAMEHQRFALLLRPSQGGHIVISPQLLASIEQGEGADANEANLKTFLTDEKSAWRTALEGGLSELLSEGSARFLQEKVLKQGAKVSMAEASVAEQAYAILVEALLRELDVHATEHGGWLDGKLQLFIYHHVAKLHEARDAVVAALRGEEEPTAALPETYRNAVVACRSEVQKVMADGGLKVKKLFSHEQVIRFHQPPKGLAVPKETCVFLRERPQCSTDNLRKTPSIFRDLVRFRCPGSPLGSCIEDPGLGLVFTVTSYTPRALLVVSPLLLLPEKVREAAAWKWSEITAGLKDHLMAFIAQESSAWRSYIQLHASTVQVSSLRTIQRVLKNSEKSVGENGKPHVDPEVATNTAVVTAQAAQREAEKLREQAEEKCAGIAAKLKAATKAAEEAAEEAEKRQKELEAAHAQTQLVAEERYKKAKESKEKKERKLQEAVEQRDQLEEKYNTLEEKCNTLEAKCNTLDESLQEKTEENAELLESHHELLELAGVSEEHSADLMDSNHELLELAGEAEKERKAAKRRLVVIESQLKHSAKRLRASEAEAQKVADARHEAHLKEVLSLTETQVNLRSDVERLTAEAQEAKKAADAAGQQAEEARRAEAQLAGRLRASEEEAARLQSSCNSLQSEAQLALEASRRSERRTSELESAAAQHQQAEAERRAEVTRLTTEAANLQESLLAAKAEASGARVLADKSTARAKEAMNTILEAQKDAQARQKELASAVECREQFRMDLERRTAELRQAQEAAASSVQQADESRREKAQLAGRLRAAEDEAGRCKNEATERELEAQRVAAQAQAVARSTKDELEARVREVKSLSEKREQLRSDVERLTAEMQQAKDAEAAASQQVEESRRAEAQLAGRLRASEEEAARLQARCTSMQIEAQEAIRVTEKRILELELANAKHQQAEKRCREQLESLSGEAADLRERCTALKAQAIQAEQDTAVAKAALSRSQESQRQLAVRADAALQLEAANAALRIDIADAVAREAKVAQRETEALEALSQAQAAAQTTRADLEDRLKEVVTLMECRENLRSDVERLTAEVQQGKTATEAATQQAQEARRAEALLSGRLRSAEEEVARLGERCKSLQSEAYDQKANATAAASRAAAAEGAATEARLACARVEADQQAKATALSVLQTAHAELREAWTKERAIALKAAQQASEAQAGEARAAEHAASIQAEAAKAKESAQEELRRQMARAAAAEILADEARAALAQAQLEASQHAFQAQAAEPRGAERAASVEAEAPKAQQASGAQAEEAQCAERTASVEAEAPKALQRASKSPAGEAERASSAEAAGTEESTPQKPPLMTEPKGCAGADGSAPEVAAKPAAVATLASPGARRRILEKTPQKLALEDVAGQKRRGTELSTELPAKICKVLAESAASA